MSEVYHKLAPVLTRKFCITPPKNPLFRAWLPSAWLRDLAGPDTCSEFALLVANLLANGLDAEGSQIVDRITKIVSVAEPQDVPGAYMPFLVGLPEHFKQLELLLSRVDYPALFAAIVTRYIRVFLGAMPELGWNRSRPCTRCSCPDCAQLNAFLAHCSAMRQRFTMPGPRRKHLEQELGRCGAAVRQTTDTQRTLFTLVVTKTDLASDNPLAEWEKRAQQAQQVISGIDRDARTVALGDDFDENIFATRLGKEALEPAATRLPLTERASNVGTRRPAESDLIGGPPTKRAKYHIIDLT